MILIQNHLGISCLQDVYLDRENSKMSHWPIRHYPHPGLAVPRSEPRNCQ